MKTTRTIFDEPLVFKPLPHQAKVLLSDASYIALVGGIGSGKTFCGSVWAAIHCDINRRTIGFIGANTFGQLHNSTLIQFFQFLDDNGIDYVFNKKPPEGWCRSKFKKHDGIITVETGAQIVTGSLEYYQFLRGMQLGWAWIDEARDTKPEAFQVLKGRLREKNSLRRQMLITTSPAGYNWLYSEFVEKKTKFHELIHAKTYDNVYLPKDYVEALVTTFDKRYAKQELDGEFVNIASGSVYYNFNRIIHVLDYNKPANPDLPLHIASDFNVSPMSTAIMQIENGTVYVIDEIVIDSSSTQQVCKEIANRYGTFRDGVWKGRIFVYPDPAGTQKQHARGESDLDIYRQNGFPAIMYKKKHPMIRDRINAVNHMLKNGKDEVRLYVNPQCVETIKSFEKLAYKEGTNLPDKSMNIEHITDAIGYFIDYKFPFKKPKLQGVSY
jgi:PBSX family phage terminase large subunit